MRFATLLAAFILAPALAAQPKPLPEPAEPVRASDSGACAFGQASAWLDVGDVAARMLNNGGLFWREVPPPTPNSAYLNYRLPKTSTHSPLFAQTLWVGGTVGGEDRASAALYGSGAGYELWPGPLDEAGDPPANCADFDRIWSVSRSDLLTYEATGFATADLAEWPVHLGAPVLDGDGIPNNYDLEAGDRPDLLGDQTLFWVMNDRGNAHGITGSESLGIEVRVLAWAKRSADPAIREATFYRYEIIYRGVEPLEDAYVGLFIDPDIGEHVDDYSGTSPERRLFYAYNGHPNDYEYGSTPPAVGTVLLSTPNDAPLAAARFMGGSGPYTEVINSVEHAMNGLRGLWRDGQPIRFGGDGLVNTTEEVTTFTFPNAPPAYWSEMCLNGTTPGSTAGCSTSTVPRDVKGILSAGPFTLQPGESTSFTVANTYARGSDRLDSVVQLLAATDAVQAAFDSGVLMESSGGVVDAPTGVGAFGYPTGNNSTSFDVGWNPVPGALTYTVQVGDDEEFGSFRTIYTEETQLTSVWNNDFIVRVRAETADGLSPWSKAAPILFGSTEPTALVEPLVIRTVQPNPTRAGATVAFTLPASGEVRLDVVDLLGRTVRELADGPREAGPHELTFDASSLAAGVYVLRLRSGSEQATTRFTVVP